MFVGVPRNPRGITTDAPGGIRKRYITRALVQAHGATDGCPACQGDGQVHVPRCRKLFEDIFDQEKQPSQPREVAQRVGPDHAAEQVVSGDQRVQMEQERHLHGLKLDEEQVRAGRETEVKRMLEFEV